MKASVKKSTKSNRSKSQVKNDKNNTGRKGRKINDDLEITMSPSDLNSSEHLKVKKVRSKRKAPVNYNELERSLDLIVERLEQKDRSDYNTGNNSSAWPQAYEAAQQDQQYSDTILSKTKDVAMTYHANNEGGLEAIADAVQQQQPIISTQLNILTQVNKTIPAITLPQVLPSSKGSKKRIMQEVDGSSQDAEGNPSKKAKVLYDNIPIPTSTTLPPPSIISQPPSVDDTIITASIPPASVLVPAPSPVKKIIIRAPTPSQPIAPAHHEWSRRKDYMIQNVVMDEMNWQKSCERFYAATALVNLNLYNVTMANSPESTMDLLMQKLPSTLQLLSIKRSNIALRGATHTTNLQNLRYLALNEHIDAQEWLNITTALLTLKNLNFLDIEDANLNMEDNRKFCDFIESRCEVKSGSMNTRLQLVINPKIEINNTQVLSVLAKKMSVLHISGTDIVKPASPVQDGSFLMVSLPNIEPCDSHRNAITALLDGKNSLSSLLHEKTSFEIVNLVSTKLCARKASITSMTFIECELDDFDIESVFGRVALLNISMLTIKNSGFIERQQNASKILSKFICLTHLYLINNGLKYNSPTYNELLTSVAKLSKLQVLDISDNPLTSKHTVEQEVVNALRRVLPANCELNTRSVNSI